MTALPAEAVLDPCRALESAVPATVSWVLPDVARDRERLDATCAALGPVVIQEAAPGASVLQLPDEITFVTWNTYLGRGNVDELVSQLRGGELTEGQPIDAFVLLLQEVYRRDILTRARALGLHAVYVPTSRKTSDPDDRGNAILSTFPIGHVLVAELPFEKQRRVAVAAEIAAAGAGRVAGSFHAVSAHFTTSTALTRGGPGAARRRQAEALIEALASLAPPIVIGGDFNTWWGDDEPAVKALRREYPDVLPLKARDTWRGPVGVGTKLDHLFARLKSGSDPDDRAHSGSDPDSLVVRRLPSRFGSDHYPLLTLVPTARVRD
jgi:endonuclease/exonuclease/phosphatase family metal-dependent hydrolase